MTQQYELVTVARGDLSENDRKEVVDKIKKTIDSEKGEIVDTQDWGKRELAFPVKKHQSGYYTFFSLQADSKLPNILNSKLKLMEELLRYLLVRKS